MLLKEYPITKISILWAPPCDKWVKFAYFFQDNLYQNNILVMTNANTITAGGAVRPTFRLNPLNNQVIGETWSDNIGYGSTYAMQLGIRYIFN